jgi:hypothetical protein
MLPDAGKLMPDRRTQIIEQAGQPEPTQKLQLGDRGLVFAVRADPLGVLGNRGLQGCNRS